MVLIISDSRTNWRLLVIHEYFGINNQIVWDIIQYRLPDLLHEISILISDTN